MDIMSPEYRPWLRGLQFEYKTPDQAKKAMGITVDEERLLTDICHRRLEVHYDAKEKAQQVLEALIEIAFKGAFTGRTYLDDMWLWNCGSLFSHFVKDTVSTCSLISQRDFCVLVSSLGQNRGEIEWHNLVNSYRILPIPAYRVYNKLQLEANISQIPHDAPPIWASLLREHFRGWISYCEESTRDQRPITVELSLPLGQRFELYVSRLDHPTHSTAYRKYFGEKLGGDEIAEFEQLVHLSDPETRNRLQAISKKS